MATGGCTVGLKMEHWLVACLGTSNPYIQIIKPISAVILRRGYDVSIWG